MHGAMSYTFTSTNPGQIIDPTDTNFSVAEPTAQLGRLYWSRSKQQATGPQIVPDDELRLIRIVKNGTGAAITTLGALLRFGATAGLYPLEIAGVTNADGARAAGGLEENYASIPIAKWFRIVVQARKYYGILANVNDARIALAAGSDVIVPYTNGQFIGQKAFASWDALTVNNVCGVSLDVTTNIAAERGARHYIELDCLRR